MRLLSALGLSFFFLSKLVLANDDPVPPVNVEAETGPAVVATGTFLSDSPFPNIVNGQRNSFTIAVENSGQTNITLKSVQGTFYNPKTEVIIRNTTAMTYGVPLVSGAKITLPYSFFSEYKPMEVRLKVFVDYTGEDDVVGQVTAYDAGLRIVEPEQSWFDLTLLSSYAFVAALIAAGSYFAYQSFFPAPRKKKVTKAPAAASIDAGASSPVVTPGSGVYAEEWIPEHHKKKSNKGKKEGGALSSGDEKSGADSGADGKKKGSRRK